MKKEQKIDIIIGIIFIIILIISWAIWFINNNKYLERYQQRCETIGWDVCEAEYYSTHTQNGLPK